jgi:hypothetical protein
MSASYGYALYPDEKVARFYVACRNPIVGDRISMFFRKKWWKGVVVSKSADDHGAYFTARTDECVGDVLLDGYGLIGPLSSARHHIWIFDHEDPTNMDQLYLQQERPMTEEEIAECNNDDLPF